MATKRKALGSNDPLSLWQEAGKQENNADGKQRYSETARLRALKGGQQEDEETAQPVDLETGKQGNSATRKPKRDAPKPGNIRATFHVGAAVVRRLDAIHRAAGIPKGETVEKAISTYCDAWERKADADTLAAYRAILRAGR